VLFINPVKEKDAALNSLFLLQANQIKMEISLDKIKSISIENFMVGLGHEIVSTTNTSIFFKSPFRVEATASFSIHKSKNRWSDFGETKDSGDIIDLAMKLWKTDFKETIQKLGNKDYSKHTPIINSLDSETTYQLKKRNDTVQNKALLQYMRNRAIDPIKIKGMIGEIYYLIKNKNYFALAFENDKGGFEIRNKYFKGCIGKKYFTTIRKGFNSITVFEGFIDLLSLMTTKELKSDIIVLNSCCNALAAIPIISSYDKAFLALDNDPTGNHTTTLIQEGATTSVKDISNLYEGYKDVNNWLTRKAY